MTTILLLLLAFVAIGVFARSYSVQTRVVMVVCVLGALALLYRGG